MTSSTIPVVVCVDIEPDDRLVTRDRPEWRGVAPTLEIVEGWRTRFGELTGAPARFSWFWRADPQVAEVYGDAAWGFHRYRQLLDDTGARGDAHGMHPHAWRRRGAHDDWIQDRADPRWVERCIDMSLQTFRAVTGEACLVTRMGDRALDAVAYRRLAHHGVLVDLSVEPGEPPFREQSTAPTPDFATAPTHAYRPRRRDVTRPSRFTRGPLLLPLSATIGASPDGHDRRLRTVYPWLATAPALAAELLDAGARYLAFAVRSDISLRPELRPHFEALLGALATHPRARSLRFVTPIEAVAMLERRGRAAP